MEKPKRTDEHKKLESLIFKIEMPVEARLQPIVEGEHRRAAARAKVSEEDQPELGCMTSRS